MDLAKFQQEVGEWGGKNFENRAPWMALHGIVEELGEMTTATRQEEALDAAGDCMIFLAHFCYMTDRDLDVIWDTRTHHGAGKPLLAVVGLVLHHHLKLVQGIRGSSMKHNAGINQGLAQIIIELIRFFGEDRFLKAVEETWERVSKRDWKKDPENGGEV